VLAKAALSGVLVAIVGGVLAWRRNERGTPSGRAWRTAAAAGAASIAFGVLVEGSGLAGAFVAILGVACAGAFAVAPLLRFVRSRVGSLGGPFTVRLGLRETVWYPGDVEIAMAALVLAVATGIGVGLMVESFRADFTRVLDQRLSHDMFVDLEGIDATALAASIAARFPAARIQAGGRGRIDIDGRPVELVHARFDAAEAARYGHVARLEPFEAMANERFARLYDLWAGASVALPNATVRIVHVYAGYGDAQPRLLVDDSTAQAVLGQLVRDRLSITAADTEALASFVHGEAMNANVERRAEVRATALAVFDRTFAITGALTLLATRVAFAGMYNALSAMRLGQRASRARLDALGVVRGTQRGLAIGIVNIAQELHGVQVGLINTARTKPSLRVLPLVNVHR
jgi:putative ABC transport system permease protein